MFSTQINQLEFKTRLKMLKTVKKVIFLVFLLIILTLFLEKFNQRLFLLIKLKMFKIIIEYLKFVLTSLRKKVVMLN